MKYRKLFSCLVLLTLLLVILIISGIVLVRTFASPPAPLWAGILNNARAIDWSRTNPGVVGGIPSASWPLCNTTACSALAATGATIAQINDALSSAPANSVVLLSPGTYNLSSAVMMRPNVVLRGHGASQTTLHFIGSSPCNGQGAHVCFIDQTAYYYGSQATAYNTGSNSAMFCGTGTSAACSHSYTQGETHLQFENVGSAGFKNGDFIILDQQNDNPSAASQTTGPIICDNANSTDGCSAQGKNSPSPGRCSSGAFGSGAPVCGSNAGNERNQIQMVQVVSGCSSACTGSGPFAVTVDNGLYAKTWSAAKNPGAWWTASNMQHAGLEDLTVDNSSDTSPTSGIMFQGAYNDWILNVRSTRGSRNHVWLLIAAHITIQNSYFYSTASTTSQSYGIEPYYTDASLMVNNVFQQVTQPVVFGNVVGSVFAFNFSVYNVYTTPAGWLEQMIACGHDAGTMYNLIEGNIGQGCWADVFHGTGYANTAFRNVLLGWQSIPPTTMSNTPGQLESYQREWNFIGNVLGCHNNTNSYPGNCGTPYHAAYITNVGVGASGSVWDFGGGNRDSTGGCSPECIVQFDGYVQKSVMLWGNYDTYHRDTVWDAKEVPSSLTDGFAIPAPASHTLPASFYSAQKPSWWPSSGAPWPVIGPDVTTGGTAIPGTEGHAQLNPAALCYFNGMKGSQDGSGALLTFDPTTCYSASSSSPPIEPPEPPGLNPAIYSGTAAMSGKSIQ